jgi:hypothetical protein
MRCFTHNTATRASCGSSSAQQHWHASKLTEGYQTFAARMIKHTAGTPAAGAIPASRLSYSPAATALLHTTHNTGVTRALLHGKQGRVKTSMRSRQCGNALVTQACMRNRLCQAYYRGPTGPATHASMETRSNRAQAECISAPQPALGADKHQHNVRMRKDKL